MTQKTPEIRAHRQVLHRTASWGISVLPLRVLMLPPQLRFLEESPDLPYNHVLGSCGNRAHSVFAEFTHQAVSV